MLANITETDVDTFVALEHSEKDLSDFRKRHPASQAVLVVFEPRCVNPSEHRLKTFKRYDHVLVISPSFKISGAELYWSNGHLPSAELVKTYLEMQRSARPRLRGIGIVNENKFSAVQGERYSFRRKAIHFLAQNNYEVRVYGKNWLRGSLWTGLKVAHSVLIALLAGQKLSIDGLLARKMKSGGNLYFEGPTISVIDSLQQFQFALVIENETSYLSEKLFNALLAGCVPIYNGPSLSQFGVPENIYITLPDLTIESMKLIDSKTEANLDEMRAAGRFWLLSEETQLRWGLRESCVRLFETISELD